MLNADTDNTVKGFVGVMLVMAAWAAMMYSISKVQFKEASYKGIVATIAGIAAIVYSITILKDAIRDNPTETLVAALGVLGTMYAITKMIEHIGKTGMSFTGAKKAAILEVIASIIAVAGGIAAIAYFAKDVDTILAAAAGISVVIGVFGIIAERLSYATKNPSAGAIFATIAGTVLIIAGSLIELVKAVHGKEEALLNSVLAISGIAMVFAMIATIASDITNAVDVLITLSAIALSAIGFATAISILTNHPWQNILIALGSLAGAAVIFGVIAGILGAPAIGQFVLLGAINLDLIAVALVGISLAASIFISAITGLLPILKDFITTIFGTVVDNRDKLAETGAALIPFAGGLAAVGAAGIVLMLGSAGLMSGAVGITALSVALGLLSKVDLVNLSTNIDKIVAPLLKFGLVAAALGTLNGLLVAAGVGFTALGIGVGLAMNAITDKSVKQMEEVPKKMYEIGLWIPRSLSRGMESSKSEAINMAMKIANGIEETIRNILQIHSNSPLFNEIGEWIPKSMTTGIDGGMTDMLNSVGLDMSKLASSFDISSDTYSSGYNTGYNYGQGVKNGAKEGWKGLGQYFKDWWNGMGFINWNTTADDILNKKKKDDRTVDQKNAGTYRGVTGPSLLTQKKNEAKNSKSSVNDFTKSLGDFTKAAGGAGGSASKAADAITDLSSAFQYASKSSKVHLGDMINNLKSNIKAHISWTNDLKKLVGKGYDKAVIEWVESMGEGGHETVKALMKGTEAEVDTLNKNLKVWLNMDSSTENALLKQYGEAGSDMALAYVNAFGDVYDTELADRIQSAIDPFGEFNRNVELTAGQMLSNMKSQLEGVGTWNENMKKLLEKGVSEDIYNYFLEQGVSSYEQVAAMVNMTDDQIKQANDMFAQQLEIGREVAKQQAAKYQEVGMAITQGLAEGTDLESVKQTGEQIGSTVLNATKEVLGIHSPADEYIEVGKRDDEGLKIGTLSYAHLAYSAAQQVAKQMLNVTYGILNEESGEEIGMFLMRGLRRGIDTGANDVYSAVGNVCNKIIEKARQIFDENSPSKVFEEIGYYLPVGGANGIKKGSDKFIGAIDEMVVSTIDKMASVVSAISQNLDGEFSSIDPMITPHLNLEELQNGRSLIDRLFGAGPGLELAESIAADNNANNVNPNPETTSEQQPTNNQTIIFNQTNNSPKNIDPYESYRLNRLAAEQLKGAFT